MPSPVDSSAGLFALSYVRKTGAGKTPKGRPFGDGLLPCSMSNPSFTVEVFNERDIVISKPESEFEVTYRRNPITRCWSRLKCCKMTSMSQKLHFWLKRGS